MLERSRFCVDPIEKKPLNRLLSGTAVFPFGAAAYNPSAGRAGV